MRALDLLERKTKATRTSMDGFSIKALEYTLPGLPRTDTRADAILRRDPAATRDILKSVLGPLVARGMRVEDLVGTLRHVARIMD